MTSYLLAGGGTAGHVNPMLAIADALRDREPDATIVCVGTAEGLENTLVPERGYELITIPRIPFPRLRTLFSAGPRFISGWPKAVERISEIIRTRDVDVVIGVGGYASAPAYQAARKTGIPYVIHEANAKPGLANKWGARYTPFVGVTFPGTPLPHARTVGTPLREEIQELNIAHTQAAARTFFGLNPDKPVVMVTSGSQGARSINTVISQSAAELIAQGYQVLHITGQNKADHQPEMAGYVAVEYCSQMDLALAAATLVISRAGSATVSELCALGIPAVYVPYPVGNGEQRFNAASVVKAGGGIMVLDKDFSSQWLSQELVPVLRDEHKLVDMGNKARSVGILDGTSRMVNLIDAALSSG